MSRELSIIIPVYNTEKYLKECLDSVFETTKNESDFFDVILVDDGSTDNSEKIYEKYKGNSNVTIIKQCNSGVSIARNSGVKKSNSKYIMFLDSDDKLSNDWIEKIKKSIKSEKYDILVFAEKCKNNTNNKNEILKACLSSNGELEKCFLNTIWSKIYNRDFLIKNDISFDSNIINGEDTLFNFEVIKKAEKIGILKSNIYIFRKNLSSTTNSFNDKFVYSDIAFHKRLKDLILDCENYAELKKIYDFTIFNGIKICLQQISLTKMNYITIIDNLVENKEYESVLKNTDINNFNVNKITKYIFKLIKQKRYNRVLTLYKIRNFFKRIYYLLHKENEIMQII